MSHLQLILPDEHAGTIVYVPLNWHEAIRPAIPPRERETYLKKLVVGLAAQPKTRAFKPASPKGYYLEEISSSKEGEFSFSIIDLSKAEEELHWATAIIDMNAALAPEQVQLREVDENPLSPAQAKMKQRKKDPEALALEREQVRSEAQQLIATMQRLSARLQPNTTEAKRPAVTQTNSAQVLVRSESVALPPQKAVSMPRAVPEKAAVAMNKLIDEFDKRVAAIQEQEGPVQSRLIAAWQARLIEGMNQVVRAELAAFQVQAKTILKEAQLVIFHQMVSEYNEVYFPGQGLFTIDDEEPEVEEQKPVVVKVAVLSTAKTSKPLEEYLLDKLTDGAEKMGSQLDRVGDVLINFMHSLGETGPSRPKTAPVIRPQPVLLQGDSLQTLLRQMEPLLAVEKPALPLRLNPPFQHFADYFSKVYARHQGKRLTESPSGARIQALRESLLAVTEEEWLLKLHTTEVTGLFDELQEYQGLLAKQKDLLPALSPPPVVRLTEQLASLLPMVEDKRMDRKGRLLQVVKAVELQRLPARAVQSLDAIISRYSRELKALEEDEGNWRALPANLKAKKWGLGEKLAADNLHLGPAQGESAWNSRLVTALNAGLQREALELHEKNKKIQQLKLENFIRVFYAAFCAYRDLQKEKDPLWDLELDALVAEILLYYDAYPLRELHLSRRYQGFAQFFIANYAKYQDPQLPEISLDLERQRIKTKIEARTDQEWVDRFSDQEVGQIFNEVARRKEDLSRRTGLLNSFDGELAKLEGNFEKQLDAIAAQEAKARQLINGPLLEEVLRTAGLFHIYQNFISGEKARHLAQLGLDFKRAMQEACQGFQFDEAANQKQLQNPEFSRIQEELQSYQSSLNEINQRGAELPLIAPTYRCIQGAREQATRLGQEIVRLRGDMEMVASDRVKFANLDKSLRSSHYQLIHAKQRLLSMAGDKQASAQNQELRRKHLSAEAEFTTQQIQAKVQPVLSRVQQEISLLEEQLKFEKILKQILEKVPFWNSQVSGVRGPKIAYWDAVKGKEVNLFVSDGIGEMILVMRDQQLSVKEKLDKVKSIADKRLTQNRSWFFWLEKPVMRRQPVQEAYKALQQINSDDPASLVRAAALIQPLEEKYQKVKVVASKVGFFQQASAAPALKREPGMVQLAERSGFHDIHRDNSP